MPRRLWSLAAILGLAVAAGGAGCADDVSPAARIGDTKISHDDLMAEVEQWAQSPALVERLAPEAAPRSNGYDTQLVKVVLTNRINFDVFGAEFDRLGLDMDPALSDQIRLSLFPDDPDGSAQVAAELDPDFLDQLAEDIAKQLIVQDSIEDVDAFIDGAFADVEVSPRYGTYDRVSGTVIAPEGPRPAPGSAPVFEL